MPRRPRQLSSTGIYHLMLRGVNRQRIFEEPADYEYFLNCLKKTQEISNATFYAYCLMTNHIHLLIGEGWESISVTMKRIGVRYAGWFNRKYNRVGHLFQDRFRSKAVTDDAYYLMVLLYIHNNPVKAGLCALPSEYQWSSRKELDHPGFIVDCEALEQLVSKENLLQAEEAHDSVQAAYEMLAFDENQVRRTDDEVWKLACELSGAHGGSSVQRLQVESQQEIVQALRSLGVPIRQISRVTGLSNTCVYKWGL